ASRRMTDSELAICRTSGVADITEIVVGRDGIVLANSKAAKQYNFKISQIFQAVAADIVPICLKTSGLEFVVMCVRTMRL
ncbi:MAG: hypothetical protein KJP23_10970, partial [Deltaproteobacteria bacterium]|nr:hypothetical protein [Deltaproteobacteria bacterium]